MKFIQRRENSPSKGVSDVFDWQSQIWEGGRSNELARLRRTCQRVSKIDVREPRMAFKMSKVC